MLVSGVIFVTRSHVLKPFFTSQCLSCVPSVLAETQSMPGAMDQDRFDFHLSFIVGLEDVARVLAFIRQLSD